MIYPKFLKDGDTIGITALSMGIDDKKLESFEKSMDNLHSKGFNTFFTSNVYSNEKLVSSSSTTRAKEFNDLVTDDKINMIQGNGRKPKKTASRIIRIAFKISGSPTKKKANISFILTSKGVE